MKNSLVAIFDEIWPNTLYYNSTGCLAQFLSKLKIRKNLKFDRNQLKLSIQHKNMYMYQKKL